VYIDEIAGGDVPLFLRDFFRSLGVTVCLLGTNSKLANAVWKAGISGQNQPVKIWSIIHTRGPRLCIQALSALQKVIDGTGSEAAQALFNLICKLKQATPLFSIEALKALTKLHATATPIECLTTAIEAVKKGVLFRKQSEVNDPQFQRSQAMMLMQEGTKVTKSDLGKHVAVRLDSEEPIKTYATFAGLVDAEVDGKPFKAEELVASVVPASVDPLMHLALSTFCKDPQGSPQATRLFLDANFPRAEDLPWSGGPICKRDGDRLEVVALASALVASHKGGVGGQSFAEFLTALAVELAVPSLEVGMKVGEESVTNCSKLLSKKRIKVPMVLQSLPEDWDSQCLGEGVLLGLISRIGGNADRDGQIEASIGGKLQTDGVFIKAKNHEGAIGRAVVNQITANFSRNAHPVGIAIVSRLSNAKYQKVNAVELLRRQSSKPADPLRRRSVQRPRT
jgi:hypothetical protein